MAPKIIKLKWFGEGNTILEASVKGKCDVKCEVFKCWPSASIIEFLNISNQAQQT